ncbi:hypothetical protein ACFCX0_48310 [Streptomyces sp. NPDC056352]|uniref:hypothetical protein n=1 Tax=Streptomyces sp. NPDC056352 TaxID=3345791 RepID=UPI0035D85B6A
MRHSTGRSSRRDDALAQEITVLHIASTIDEAHVFARHITHLRSYLGAYTDAFRQGDTVHLSRRLVHIQGPTAGGFGIGRTPWSATESYLANLAR